MFAGTLSHAKEDEAASIEFRTVALIRAEIQRCIDAPVHESLATPIQSVVTSRVLSANEKVAAVNRMIINHRAKDFSVEVRRIIRNAQSNVFVASDNQFNGGAHWMPKHRAAEVAVIMPEFAQKTTLPEFVIAHELGHVRLYALAHEKDPAILEYLRSDQSPTVEYLEEVLAIHSEWELLHAVPDQIKRETLAELSSHPSFESITGFDHVKSKLQDSRLGFDTFLPIAQRLRGYELSPGVCWQVWMKFPRSGP